jgi:hypothetical protein
MKKILSLVVLLAVMTATAFASEEVKINPIVEETFSKTFSGAQHVSWKVMTEERIHRATFLYNNERLNAFFDIDGNLIGTGRFIQTSNLPLLVSRNLAAKYPNSEIKEVIEYVQSSETSYLVTIETPKSVVTVRAFPIGTSYVFKKEKK